MNKLRQNSGEPASAKEKFEQEQFEEKIEQDETIESLAAALEENDQQKIEEYAKMFRLMTTKYKVPEVLAKQLVRFEYNWVDEGVNRSNVHIVLKLIDLICDGCNPTNAILIFVSGLSEIKAIENGIRESIAHRHQIRLYSRPFHF